MPTFAAFKGKWQIKYDNGFSRAYTINNLGFVTSLDGKGRKIAGRLVVNKDVYHLAIEPNKIERIIQMSDGTIKIEHFSPASGLEGGGEPIKGVGVRVSE